MATTSSEEISRATSSSIQKPDVNTANDSNNLGGIPAENFATKEYVNQLEETRISNLKDYVDTQDNSILQQAKNYADTVVQNQDFSNFAELQDLQALNVNLGNQITQCGIDCSNKIDSEISEVVRDVNANFDDVGASINGLNANMNQLFTSVSNGKTQIAEAITDKGVLTSADDSFVTMANHIEQIETGGGGGDDPEYDENFVNTGDATAISEDIGLGKTAYVKGVKLWGTHKDLNTNDATASPNDIMDGKSAYVNGIKIYGTFEPLDTSDATAQPQHILKGRTAYVNENKITGTFVPESGLDTSDATATASDIMRGATAYVNGELIIGTLEPRNYFRYTRCYSSSK